MTTSNGRPLAGAAATKQNFDTRIVPQPVLIGPPLEVTAEQQEALEAARTLIELGVPLFIARPALNGGQWDPHGGTGGCGYLLPRGWHNSVCDISVLDSEAGGWRPGWALCALMGHTLDLLDVDPRNGGDVSRDALVAQGVWPAVLAMAATPSGGTHEFVKALGVGSRDAVLAGFDVKGGRSDGTGRGLAFVAPTVKLSKTTGELELYEWIDPPRPTMVPVGDTSGQALAEIIQQALKQPGRESMSLSPARPVPAQAAIPAGQRHDELFKHASSFRGQGVPREEADTRIRGLWTRCEQPEGNVYRLEDALKVLCDVYERYGATPAREPMAQESAVQHELNLLRAREQAKEMLRLEKAGLAVYPPVIPLTEFLSTRDEPVTYLVEDLWPIGGRVVLAAQHKAGKSTLRDNLVRALVDSAPFLGQFYVAPFQGQVVLIDDELDERMLRRWLREQGIGHPERVHVVSLRGWVGSFDLTNDVVRARWAEQFQQLGAEVIILDCLRPILDALGLSEDKEAGRFLVGFDALLAESGASEGMIVHHMGHSGERSRGDTRLRDWPDVEWQLVREGAQGEQQADARRFFKAYGRDVNVPEGLLEYHEDTRRLLLAGGSRKQQAAGELIPQVMAHLDTNPGATGRGIEGALQSLGRTAVRDAVKQAVKDGRVRIQLGARGAVCHFNVDGDQGDEGSAPSAP